MAEADPIDPFPPNSISDHSDLSTEFDSLPVPTPDPLLFPHHIDSAPPGFLTDLGLGDDDFELDLDFSFEDFYMDDHSVGMMLSEHKVVAADRASPVDCKDSNSFHNSEDRNCVVDSLNCASDGKESCDDDCKHVFGADKLKKSGVCSSDSSGENDTPSTDGCSVDIRELSKGQILVNHISGKVADSSSEFSRPASSQGSGNVGSGSEAMDLRSHNFDRDVSSKVPVFEITVKEKGKKYMPKRKKESEEGFTESRIHKFRKSTANMVNDASAEPEDEKRKARLIRNRESAQLSRQRKKHYVEELEDKIRAMHATITDLNGKVSYIMAENASLRQQLGGVVGPPPPGVYPLHPVAPMGYPWMPYPPYAMNGSQTPLIPIPRLKPQQARPAPKSKKTDSKKSESRKSEVKTKKVASISLLGLLFFLFLFGALIPMVTLKHGGVGTLVLNRNQDMIITVNANSNRPGGGMGSGFSNVKLNNDNKGRHHRGSYINEAKKAPGDPGKSSKEGNSSLPLVASLYVPRNDKLVKIDGNLIIHSVLASEKAMASQKTFPTEESKKNGLAVAKNVAPPWVYSEAGKNRYGQPHMYKNQNERRRELADSSKASADDSQEWFREGLAGPMLSSGSCTEVFQFDMSPEANPGAVIPSTSAKNTSANHQSNTTQLSKRLSRRSLHGIPNLENITEHMESNYTKKMFHSNKSASPMVVSVLVDPKDVSDSEAEGIVGPKSVGRIFVVVLQERVKYVTYSCVLPIKKASNPHLVTT